MDAVLPADLMEDEIPSGFSIVGHVGTSMPPVQPKKTFTENESKSPSKLARRISSIQEANCRCPHG